MAPGFTPVPWGTPNPDTPGTSGPLGRPKSDPGRITAQLQALKQDLMVHYPGIRFHSDYRTADQQNALGGQNPSVWVGSTNGSSHRWGTGLDLSVGPAMWERIKADIRSRGLRAYDEGGHIHVDDRTDLPNGPSERKRR